MIMEICFVIFGCSLTSVDVVLLMKTAGVVENSGHCMHSIGLRCFLNCHSLLQLEFCLFNPMRGIS